MAKIIKIFAEKQDPKGKLMLFLKDLMTPVIFPPNYLHFDVSGENGLFLEGRP
jgi:hypothetical protein